MKKTTKKKRPARLRDDAIRLTQLGADTEEAVYYEHMRNLHVFAWAPSLPDLRQGMRCTNAHIPRKQIEDWLRRVRAIERRRKANRAAKAQRRTR